MRNEHRVADVAFMGNQCAHVNAAVITDRHLSLQNHAFLQVVANAHAGHAQVDGGVQEIAQLATRLDDLASRLIAGGGAAGDQVDEPHVVALELRHEIEPTDHGNAVEQGALLGRVVV
ncbi:hypothetical protein D3C78_1400670 [compost metagenome]